MFEPASLRAEPVESKEVEVSEKPLKVNVENRIAADGDAAVIKDLLVPRPAKEG